MKVTIEDIARTICLAAWEYDYTPREKWHRPDVRWTEAMNAAKAVAKTHMQPMLADLYHAAGGSRTAAENYAARIIADLTANPPAPE